MRRRAHNCRGICCCILEKEFLWANRAHFTCNSVFQRSSNYSLCAPVTLSTFPNKDYFLTIRNKRGSYFFCWRNTLRLFRRRVSFGDPFFELSFIFNICVQNFLRHHCSYDNSAIFQASCKPFYWRQYNVYQISLSLVSSFIHFLRISRLALSNFLQGNHFPYWWSFFIISSMSYILQNKIWNFIRINVLWKKVW